MTNEIKEILEYLKDDSMFIDDEDGIRKEITLDESKLLLDYITNLQEEKENAVECLKYYEEKHFIKPAVDNMKLTTELYNAYSKEINDLQQRIDQAVEILKDTSIDMPETLLIETIDYASHILRGDE